jgi:hypothetical protein
MAQVPRSRVRWEGSQHLDGALLGRREAHLHLALAIDGLATHDLLGVVKEEETAVPVNEGSVHDGVKYGDEVGDEVM